MLKLENHWQLFQLL